MSASIIEQISDNVLTTLNGITTGNGYAITMTFYRPSKVIDVLGSNKGFLSLKYVDPSDKSPARHAQWDARFEVLCATMPHDGDTTPVGTYQNAMRSAIEKALMVDPHRNNLALDTLPRGCEILDEINGGFDGIIVKFDVMYRTLVADPFSR